MCSTGPSVPISVDRQALDRDGFCVADGMIDTPSLRALREEFDRVLGSDRQRRAGARSPLFVSDCFASLAGSAGVRSIVEPLLGRGAFAVRSLLFDKRADANWNVAWHRDTTIAVKERIETPGYGPWSVKDGAHHVRPRVRVLANMVTLRIHLDDCDETNGALRVVPGSHRLSASVADGLDDPLDMDWCQRASVVCPASAGSVLVMRPLLLHASRKATAVGRRRVLHLEFAADALDGELRWAVGDAS